MLPHSASGSMTGGNPAHARHGSFWLTAWLADLLLSRRPSSINSPEQRTLSRFVDADDDDSEMRPDSVTLAPAAPGAARMQGKKSNVVSPAPGRERGDMLGLMNAVTAAPIKAPHRLVEVRRRVDDLLSWSHILLHACIVNPLHDGTL